MHISNPSSKSRLFSPSISISLPKWLLTAWSNTVCCTDDFVVMVIIHSHVNGRSRRSAPAFMNGGMIMKGMDGSISSRNMLSKSSASDSDGSWAQEASSEIGAGVDTVPFDAAGVGT